MKPIEEVTMLYEITKALNAHLILKKSLYKVLDILSNSMNMVRGTITILNPMRNEIRIEVAHGLTRNAMERVKYKLGEGITGRVIETGEAVSIPKIIGAFDGAGTPRGAFGEPQRPLFELSRRLHRQTLDADLGHEPARTFLDRKKDVD